MIHEKNNLEWKKVHDVRNYHRTKMQKDSIIKKLKEKGYRITKQRLTLIDIILDNECSCCKEIYYKASKIDKRIGTATVYRMINTLEEIDAISRNNRYKVFCFDECDIEDVCMVELDDNTVCNLSAKKLYEVIATGLKACGYMKKQNIRSVVIKKRECENVESN